MTGWQKFIITSEALGWLMLTLVLVVVGFPVGVVLILLATLLKLIHIGFVMDLTEKFLHSLTESIKYITERIKGLTRKVNAMKGITEEEGQGE